MQASLAVQTANKPAFEKAKCLRGAIFAGCLFTLVCSFTPLPAQCAEDLRLRPGVSFVQDTDNGFPITGEKMSDVALADSSPTFIFFGASGDLNTNRQAKRLVDSYKRYKDKPIKFVVIDVDHLTNAQAKAVAKQYYKGYIPCQVLLDAHGHPVWTQVGEIEGKMVEKELDKVL